MDPVTQYATDVVAKKVVVGDLVRRACQRHLRDLEDQHRVESRWEFDEVRAGDIIEFFSEVLRLAEGEFAGKPFELQPWQAFIQGSLYGWKRKDGFRRFRQAYIEVGKGSGKSPMAGGTSLYMLCADGEVGAHCYAAATSLEQADEVFRDAVKMVEASPALRDRLRLSGKSKVFNIAHIPTGSFLRKVSAEHRGLDGKRIHFAVLDEVHEANRIVINKITKGTKGRRQPLIYEITNSGYNRDSVCWDHHDYSRRILEGHQDDDEWFAYVCTLDPGDDWKDEKVWVKANPNLGVSIGWDYLRREVKQAIGIPSQENITKRLNFCIWTESSMRWMQTEMWDACAKWAVDSEALKGQRCYGGLDLALTRDLSAFVLLFPPTHHRPFWAVLPWFWIPRDDLMSRSNKDHVPYDVWEKAGFVTVTPGNVTDHDFIEAKIKELAGQYTIEELAYDPSRATQLITHLQDFFPTDTVVPVEQTCHSMNPAVCFLEKTILEGKLGHGGNPILRSHCANAVTVANSSGEVKFDKMKATGRVDGMTAIATAFKRAVEDGSHGPSVYETRGLLTI